MAATPDGRGYWLVASDGGIFNFGDARFYGSTGSLQLDSPIVAMTSSSDGAGYWLVASDGGVFSYGDSSFYGSLGGTGASVSGLEASAAETGYQLIETDHAAQSFGPPAPAAAAHHSTTTHHAPFHDTTTQPGSSGSSASPSGTALGIYGGGGDPQAVSDFTSSVGAQPEYAMDFLDGTSWSTITGSNWPYSAWAGKGFKMIWGVDMLPNSYSPNSNAERGGRQLLRAHPRGRRRLQHRLRNRRGQYGRRRLRRVLSSAWGGSSTAGGSPGRPVAAPRPSSAPSNRSSLPCARSRERASPSSGTRPVATCTWATWPTSTRATPTSTTSASTSTTWNGRATPACPPSSPTWRRSPTASNWLASFAAPAQQADGLSRVGTRLGNVLGLGPGRQRLEHPGLWRRRRPVHQSLSAVVRHPQRGRGDLLGLRVEQHRPGFESQHGDGPSLPTSAREVPESADVSGDKRGAVAAGLAEHDHGPRSGRRRRAPSAMVLRCGPQRPVVTARVSDLVAHGTGALSHRCLATVGPSRPVQISGGAAIRAASGLFQRRLGRCQIDRPPRHRARRGTTGPGGVRRCSGRARSRRAAGG